MRLTRWVASAFCAALVAAAAGCSGTHSRSVRADIDTDTSATLADQAVHLRISELAPNDDVTVTSTAVDYLGMRWQAQAVFRSDRHGTIDLDKAAPKSGTYSGADGMGLFWSMDPANGDGDKRRFGTRRPDLQPSYNVVISVSVNGHELASKTLTREWLSRGATCRALTLAADKVVGDLCLPSTSTSTTRKPAVLVFGGSEGGNSLPWEAALLASHGYPALSVGYFGLPGLPAHLSDVPLEYFATAARLLAAQPGVDSSHLVTMGYSRGSEAALLLADDYSTLIHGAVLYSPSAVAHEGWTYRGAEVAQGPIAVNRVGGPVLAIAGADDQLWSSAPWSRQIMTELDAAHDPYSHQALIYPGSGHGVGTYPYIAAGTAAYQPNGTLLILGGTRPADNAARVAGWPRVLAFLHNLA